MPSERLRHYKDLLRNATFSVEAVCWTVIWPADVPGVIRRLGLDPHSTERLGLAAAYHRYLASDPTLLFDQVGEAVTLFEHYGYLAVQPGIPEALSAGAEAVTAYWNVEGRGRLVHSARGTIRSEGEGRYPRIRTGSRPDSLDPFMSDLYEAVEDPTLGFETGMLAVTEAISGVRLDLDWFDQTHDAIAGGSPIPGHRRGPERPRLGPSVPNGITLRLVRLPAPES